MAASRQSGTTATLTSAAGLTALIALRTETRRVGQTLRAEAVPALRKHLRVNERLGGGRTFVETPQFVASKVGDERCAERGQSAAAVIELAAWIPDVVEMYAVDRVALRDIAHDRRGVGDRFRRDRRQIQPFDRGRLAAHRSRETSNITGARRAHARQFPSGAARHHQPFRMTVDDVLACGWKIDGAGDQVDVDPGVDLKTGVMRLRDGRRQRIETPAVRRARRPVVRSRAGSTRRRDRVPAPAAC